MNELPLAAHRPRTVPMHYIVFALVASGILLARWILLSTFGTDAPYWDQWNGEVQLMYKPFVEGTLPLSQFFAPHNEHRILFSRAFNLLLFWLNDNQFDNLVETYVNAIVYIVGLLLLAWPFFSRLSGGPTLILAGALLALFGVAPYGVENLLVGFQNAFYFMHIFAALACMALAFGERRIAFVAAIVLAIASLFTLASGLLLAPALALVALLRWRNGSLPMLPALVFVLAAAAVAAAGLALMPSSPHHATMHARDAGEFLHNAMITLSWPLPGHPLLALLLWWPSLAMTWRLARGADAEASRIDLYLLGLCGWVFLQALAIAWSRGHDLVFIPSRYADTLAIGCLANLAIGIRLIPAGPAARGGRIAATLTSLLTIACIGGFAGMTFKWAPYLVVSANNLAASRKVLGAYLDGQGTKAFEGKSQIEISFPDSNALAQLLDDPTVRRMMPTSIRPALSYSLAPCTAFQDPGTYPSTPPARHALGSHVAGTGNAQMGSCTGGTFSSPYPYLEFRIAGYPLQPGMTLALTRADGTVVPVSAPLEPAEAWMPVVVRNPGGELHWTATDENAVFWFAFTAPVEAGRLSGLRRPLDTWLDIAPRAMWP